MNNFITTYSCRELYTGKQHVSSHKKHAGTDSFILYYYLAIVPAMLANSTVTAHLYADVIIYLFPSKFISMHVATS